MWEPIQCDSDVHLGERAAFVESHVGVTGFQLEGFLCLYPRTFDFLDRGGKFLLPKLDFGFGYF